MLSTVHEVSRDMFEFCFYNYRATLMEVSACFKKYLSEQLFLVCNWTYFLVNFDADNYPLEKEVPVEYHKFLWRMERQQQKKKSPKLSIFDSRLFSSFSFTLNKDTSAEAGIKIEKYLKEAGCQGILFWY